jgi:signal transduction histidine kinase
VPFAHARGSTIELFAEAPVWVDGDPALLTVLARNLTDNAVRYAPAGARVEVRVLQTAGDAAPHNGPVGAALLRVDDSGPGIPAGERARVFDRFYRHAAGEEAGTGLGLAIVRSIAERHRATVTLGDSPLGGLRVEVGFAPAPRNKTPATGRGLPTLAGASPAGAASSNDNTSSRGDP